MATMKVNARDEIIRKGAQLIHSQGYKATGLQQILDVAGIPKGSFYFYFKSKDDFGAAVIDYFTLTIGEIFTSHLRDPGKTPLARPSKRAEQLWVAPSAIYRWSWPMPMTICAAVCRPRWKGSSHRLKHA